MTINPVTCASTTLALLVGLTGGFSAQSKATSHAGVVEHIKVHGQALEGNLEGDSPDREVTIYLPPSYATERARRYPVVYLLHGYGGTDGDWTGRLAKFPRSPTSSSLPAPLHEMIVVMPNAFSLHKGSMYSNSVTSGDWETYIAHDLVAYVDGHYRTIPDRLSRGLAGHSMGGYGAVRIGMKRPDVFSSLYMLSACCLTAQINPRPEAMAAAEAIRTREQAEEGGRGQDLDRLDQSRVRGRMVAEPRQSAAVSRSAGEGRQSAAGHRRQVGGQLATRDDRSVHSQPEDSITPSRIDVGTKDKLLASNKAVGVGHDPLRDRPRLRGIRRRPHEPARGTDRDPGAAVLLQIVVVRLDPGHRSAMTSKRSRG